MPHFFPSYQLHNSSKPQWQSIVWPCLYDFLQSYTAYSASTFCFKTSRDSQSLAFWGSQSNGYLLFQYWSVSCAAIACRSSISSWILGRVWVRSSLGLRKWFFYTARIWGRLSGVLLAFWRACGVLRRGWTLLTSVIASCVCLLMRVWLCGRYWSDAKRVVSITSVMLDHPSCVSLTSWLST